jgi:flagellar biosynthesis GTPase FlhF
VEVERSIQIDANKDAKEHVKKMFGQDAQVKDVQLIRKSAALIKNYSSKVALFTMAAIHGSKQAAIKLEAEEAKDKRLAKYNSILREYSLVADSDIAETERFENVKERMQKEKFLLKKGLDWIMDDEFKALLNRRRAQRRRFAMESADALVYQILQWYYVTMHKDARMAYGSLPSVLAEPDEAHLSVLQELKPAGYALEHPPKIISQKIKMEESAPPMSSRAWGPAFICARAKLGAKWAADEMNVDEKEVERAISLIEGIMRQPHGRGAKFLSQLKR